MNPIFMLIAVLLPILGGAMLFLHPISDRRVRSRAVFCVGLATSLLVLSLLIGRPSDTLTLIDFGGAVRMAFRLDGLSMIFASILALLWPMTNVYAFEYMSHLEDENRFFGFFTMTYGVVLGISFAANAFTLYFFYELLTLCTLPLVMHEMDPQGRYAGKKYLIFSMSGAAFAFLSMILLLQNGSLDYIFGGSLDPAAVQSHPDLLRVGFVMGLLGFGVKAALWPLHGWLPTAGVAPTPVTALLHAVAVVNAGIFSILRLLYYSYGCSFLRNSWPQYLMMTLTIITILYGSAMALRMPHLKRRLAFSTVSNLSYILFAASLMSNGGLTAALAHMCVHSVLKITLFFCAGSFLCQNHHNGYIRQYAGLGRKMPITCLTFLVSGLGLIGLPPLAGFSSKWMIASAAAATNLPLAWLGAFALVVSALLTGLYEMQVVVTLYAPLKDTDLSGIEQVKESGWQICAALIFFTVLGLILALCMGPLTNWLRLCVGGLI